MNKENVIEIYEFPNYAPELYADSKGNFWRKDNDRFVDTKYYNGRICVQVGNKRYGIKKLRSTAVKTQREIINLPF